MSEAKQGGGTTSEAKLKIGIQGGRASFHDQVAHLYFGSNIEVLECMTFPQLGESLAQGLCDRAVMAVENTIAGSILPNYSLIQKYHFHIEGEYYLRISMNLMALKGQTLEDIRWVKSHPMAFYQCEDFLLQHPRWQRIESVDTAESAREIAQNHILATAAIASQWASERYGLVILAPSIESNDQNYTRFLILGTGEPELDWRKLSPGSNKTTLSFEALHQPGSLGKVLQSLSNNGMNLTKIQSVPILGRPYEYSFHLDMEWTDPQNLGAAMKDLHQLANHVQVFGSYSRGVLPL